MQLIIGRKDMNIEVKRARSIWRIVIAVCKKSVTFDFCDRLLCRKEVDAALGCGCKGPI